MKDKLPLLPFKFRPWGYLFAITGVILLILRFKFGLKPDFLTSRVFALYSDYLQTKYFQIISNQLIEEISGLLILAGLFMIAFSREKVDFEQANSLRLKAFCISAYLNTAFLAIAILLTFGFGFVYMLIINMVIPLVIYTVSFRILKYRSTRIKNDI
jgi:hypothetical protein